MPAKSKDQFRLMAAAKHNPKFAKKVGIKPSVASEFVDKTSYNSLPQKVDMKEVRSHRVVSNQQALKHKPGKKKMFSRHPVSRQDG